jgi:hypothetical protein
VIEKNIPVPLHWYEMYKILPTVVLKMTGVAASHHDGTRHPEVWKLLKLTTY